MFADADDRTRIDEWAALLDDSNYYEILGVPEVEDGAGVKAAFQRLALAFYPMRMRAPTLIFSRRYAASFNVAPKPIES